MSSSIRARNAFISISNFLNISISNKFEFKMFYYIDYNSIQKPGIYLVKFKIKEYKLIFLLMFKWTLKHKCVYYQYFS